VEDGSGTVNPSSRPGNHLPGPFSLAYKKRVYSPNRIKYPLKRVDWDPNGERNPQNRGKSKYERISAGRKPPIPWPVKSSGLSTSMAPWQFWMQGDGHGECKTINTPHGHSGHCWRCWAALPSRCATRTVGKVLLGRQACLGAGVSGNDGPAANMCQGHHRELRYGPLLGLRPGNHPLGFRGPVSPVGLCYFWTEVRHQTGLYLPGPQLWGRRACGQMDSRFTQHRCSSAAGHHPTCLADRGDLQQGICRYPHGGYGQGRRLCMGEEDGVPKTPAWASKKCGVPEWTIKALAREFAAKTTSIAHYFGGSMFRGHTPMNPPGWSHFARHAGARRPGSAPSPD
jgi:hypothetical protein